MRRGKRILGVLMLIISLIFFVPNIVSALDINTTNINEVFKNKEVTIEGQTITLNKDVVFENPNYPDPDDLFSSPYESLTFMDGEYTINLNGHKLNFNEFIVRNSKMTINDSTGKGKLIGMFLVEDTGEVIINNGTFTFIDNAGELTIKNGTINSVFNIGNLLIENGNFLSLNQEGTATIKGGTFTATIEETEEGPVERFISINLDAKTVFAGGKFKRENIDYSIVVYNPTESDIDVNALKGMVQDGYVALMGDSTTNYGTAFYTDVEIIKDPIDDIINKLAPNGVWKIKTFKPKNCEELDFLLTSIANDELNDDKYYINAGCTSKDFNLEETNLAIYLNNYKYIGEKKVNVEYIEPDENTLPIVNSVLKEMKNIEDGKHSPKNGYLLDDLYLINYLNSTTKGIDNSLALNFSKELIDATKGSNVSFKFDDRLGDIWPHNFITYCGGRAIVYFDGVAYTTKNAGLTTVNVLYVPLDTENTTDAFIAAAMKRIKEYLGSTKGITIKVGGKFDSLDKDYNSEGFIDETISGDYYYKLTINGETYNFAISKKDLSTISTPTYIGSDIISNIYITSDATELPLDTALKVQKNSDEKIKDILGTNNYIAYDISLYSNSKQVNIKKLENGKFVVSIPVPENLKDKNITVYYINSDNEKKEYAATVVNDYASFETDHFSTYALVEKLVNNEDNSQNDKVEIDNPQNDKVEIDNPQTLDGITTYIILGFVSLIGLLGTALYFKKRIK